MKINLTSAIKTRDHDGYKTVSVQEEMWNLVAVQGDIVPCETPEGPSDDFYYHIQLANFFTGDVYQLNSTIFGHIRSETYEEEDYSEDHVWYENARIRANSLIEKMKSKGVLDLVHWTKIK